MAAAISEEFDILAGPHRPGEKLRTSRLNEAFAAFEEKVSEIRDQGGFSSTPLQTNLAFYVGFAALRSLRDELNNVRSLAQGLPRFGQPLTVAKPHWDFLPTIDWFWVKIGAKGGLAAVISILLLNWINPPGPTAIPLMAWTLTILTRPFLKAGGTGDLRAFQNSFLAALGLAACAGLLILTTPFLADYLVMNLALFLILFVFGFFTARISGINFWIQVGLLTISAFVGLNPQQPVATQTIIDTFVGLITGMGIATIVGRLLAGFAECLRQGDCRRELPSLRHALGEMDGALESIRQNEILKGQPLDAPVRVVELADLYHATGEALEECNRLVRTLQIQRYWGDYAL